MPFDYQKEVSLYMKQVNKHPLLTKEEEKELGYKLLDGDEAARNKLIISNLRFVVQQANKYKSYVKLGKFSILDLIQEGNDGLIYATDKFDIRKGYRFTTYSVWWIKARIMQFIIKSYSIVKIGTTSAERQLFFKIGYIKHLIEITDKKEKQLAREELAKTTGLTVQQITNMEERVFWDDVSLEHQTQGGADNPAMTGQFTLKDYLTYDNSNKNVSHENDLYKSIKKAIYDAMHVLNDREKDILLRRWLTVEGQTLQTIATAHNLSRERIRQIEGKIFLKLKKELKNTQTGKEIIKHLNLN